MMTFAQARRLLRTLARDKPTMSIAAVLASPAIGPFGRGGRDGWTILVNAEVAFSPTALDPDLDPDFGETNIMAAG